MKMQQPVVFAHGNSRLLVLLIVLSVLLILVWFISDRALYTSTTEHNQTLVGEEIAVGFDAIPSTGTVPGDYLYISGLLSGGSRSIPGIYALAVIDSTRADIFTDGINYDFVWPQFSSTAYFMTGSAENPDSVKPWQIDSTTASSGPMLAVAVNEKPYALAVSPDSTRVAYMVPTSNPDDPTLANWDVVVPATDSTGAPLRITAAGNPVWAADGSQLYYLKENGIYTHDFSTTTNDRKLTDATVPLSVSDELVATTDGYGMVLTQPNLNRIGVFFVDITGEMPSEELGSVTRSGMRYRNPVISPDQQFYAVIAESDEEAVIEIRELVNKQVLARIPLTDFTLGTVTLDSWNSGLINKMSQLSTEDVSVSYKSTSSGVSTETISGE